MAAVERWFISSAIVSSLLARTPNSYMEVSQARSSPSPHTLQHKGLRMSEVASATFVVDQYLSGSLLPRTGSFISIYVMRGPVACWRRGARSGVVTPPPRRNRKSTNADLQGRVLNWSERSNGG